MNTDFNISTAKRSSGRSGLFTAVIICILALSGIFALGVFTGIRLEKVIAGDAEVKPDAGTTLDAGISRDAGYEKPAGQPAVVPVKPAAVKENAKIRPDDDEEVAPPKPSKTPQNEKRVSGPQIKEPKDGPYKDGQYKDNAGGTYTVQTAALPDRNQAVALAAQLERKGYRVQISALRQEGRGPIYRVRIGRFNTAEEAKKFRDDLEKTDNLNGFVTTIK